MLLNLCHAYVVDQWPTFHSILSNIFTLARQENDKVVCFFFLNVEMEMTCITGTHISFFR